MPKQDQPTSITRILRPSGGVAASSSQRVAFIEDMIHRGLAQRVSPASIYEEICEVYGSGLVIAAGFVQATGGALSDVTAICQWTQGWAIQNKDAFDDAVHEVLERREYTSPHLVGGSSS